MKPLAALSVLFALSALAQVHGNHAAEGGIKVEIEGKPFTEFFSGPDTAKPYLHPLRSASGKIVTRRYPMESVEGEKKDHPHHQGLWFAHGDVNGLDFWSALPSRPGEKFGKIVTKDAKQTKDGDRSVITAKCEWLDSKGSALLSEERTMTFYGRQDLRFIDVDIRLTGIVPARFGDTKEGTFAIRVADSLNEQHTGKLVNAEGLIGEKNTWGKKSSWMDYSGEVEGEKLGIAILDHPENPRHPTYWHDRAYGLFAANIFGEHDFYSDKQRDGSMTLEPGKSWRFRYRVVIHPGDAESAGIADLYKQYEGGR